MNLAPIGRHRILALVLRRGVSGSAALDGFGVLEKSVRTFRLGRRVDQDPLALARVVERAARRFAPTVVVLALDTSTPSESVPLLIEAEALIRARGHVVVRRSLVSARRLFLGRTQSRARFELGTLLAEGFAPELAARLPRRLGDEAHARPVWNAVALALQELVLRTPRAAAALLRPGSRLPLAFHERLRQSDCRLHPTHPYVPFPTPSHPPS